MRPEVEALEHHAQARADARELFRVRHPGFAGAVGGQANPFAVDTDAPLIGNLQQVDAAQEGALARTAGADQGHDIALTCRQGHPLEHLELAEALVDILHLDAYRTGGAEDFEGIGFSELLEQEGVVIVEWPSRVRELRQR